MTVLIAGCVSIFRGAGHLRSRLSAGRDVLGWLELRALDICDEVDIYMYQATIVSGAGEQ